MFLNKYLLWLGLPAVLLAPHSSHAEPIYNVTILGASFRPAWLLMPGLLALTGMRRRMPRHQP